MKEVVVVAGQVQNDAIFEIFSRLPLISVLRFRFLSKDIFKLICNSNFLQKHAAKFHSSLVLKHDVLFCPIYSDVPVNPIYVNPSKDQAALPLQAFLESSLHAFRKEFPQYYIHMSCNGLLLSYECSPPPFSEEFHVFNPMLSQNKLIPTMDLLETFPDNESLCSLHIVFNPALSAYFKVLAMLEIRPLNNLKLQLHVYSSETKLWKFVTALDPKDKPLEKGAMFDGEFYLFRSKDAIRFDLLSDQVTYLPLPKMSTIYSILYVGEACGRLQLLIHNSEPLGNRPFCFKLFELEKNCDQPHTSWSETALVNVKIDDHDDMKELKPQSWQGDVRVMHLYDEEGEKSVLLLSRDSKMIFSFNMATEKFGSELILPYSDDLYTLHTVPFTPTLCPLL